MENQRRCPRCNNILRDNDRFCSVCKRYCGTVRQKKKSTVSLIERFRIVCSSCGEETLFDDGKFPTICGKCGGFFDRLQDRVEKLDASGAGKRESNPEVKRKEAEKLPQNETDGKKIKNDSDQLSLICVVKGMKKRLDIRDMKGRNIIGTGGNICPDFFLEPAFSGIAENHVCVFHEITGWYAEVMGDKIVYMCPNDHDRPEVITQGNMIKLENDALITVGDNCQLRIELS